MKMSSVYTGLWINTTRASPLCLCMKLGIRGMEFTGFCTFSSYFPVSCVVKDVPHDIFRKFLLDFIILSYLYI